MNLVLRAMSIAAAIAVMTACGNPQPSPAAPPAPTGSTGATGATGTPGGKGAHAKIRINFKADCTLRTIPKNHEVLLDEEELLVWRIKDQYGCLKDADLVIRWGTGNGPSMCSEISTATHGNKTEIKCDLNPSATAGKYPYTLYKKPNVGAETAYADPDVEIVM